MTNVTTEVPIDNLLEEDIPQTRGNTITNLVGSTFRLGYGVATFPLNILPANSRVHAKNAVREAFLTVKVLIDDVTNGIDKTLTR